MMIDTNEALVMEDEPEIEKVEESANINMTESINPEDTLKTIINLDLLSRKKLSPKEKNKLSSFIDENLKKIFKVDFEIKSQNPYYLENCKKELKNLETILKKYNLLTADIKTKFTSEFCKYEGKFIEVNKDVSMLHNLKKRNNANNDSPSTYKPEPLFKYNPENKLKMSVKMGKMKEYSEYATKPVMSKANTTRSESSIKNNFDHTSSMLNKDNNTVYDLSAKSYLEIEKLKISKTNEYKFGNPCSILQFGYSNDLYYAIGCDSYILITNSIFEVEDVVELTEKKFPLKTINIDRVNPDHINLDSENEKNKTSITNNTLPDPDPEIIDTSVRLLLNFDNAFIFSYLNYIGLYDHSQKKLVQIGKHDNLTDACILEMYKHTLVTVNSLNVIKFWNYKVPKMVKISTPSQNGIYSYTTLAVLNLNDYLILAGNNNMRLYNINLDKYIHSLHLEKDTIHSFKKISSTSKKDLFFIAAFQSGDAKIYSIDKKEDKCELTLISQIKNIFPLCSMGSVNLKMNFIITGEKFVIFNFGTMVQIYYLKMEKIKSSVHNNNNAVSTLPRLTYISKANFSQEISKIFEIEGNLYFFGHDYFTMRNMIEINEIIYKQ